MTEKIFTLPELAGDSGVEYRTLHTWLGRGLFRPSLKASEGTGHPNLFTGDDLAFVRWLARLRDVGLSIDGLEQAKRDTHPIIDALRARP